MEKIKQSDIFGLFCIYFDMADGVFDFRLQADTEKP